MTAKTIEIVDRGRGLQLSTSRVTLQDLAHAAAEPLRTTLLEQRATFLRLLGEIEAASRWFRPVAA